MKMKSRGTVRRLIEQNGKRLVSFFEHDGYFGMAGEALEALVQKAHKDNVEIAFTYDEKLTIDSVSDGPADIAGVVPEVTPFKPSPKG